MKTFNEIINNDMPYRLLPIFWFRERVPANYVVKISAQSGMGVGRIPVRANASLVRVNIVLGMEILEGQIKLELWKNDKFSGYCRALTTLDAKKVNWDIPFGELSITSTDDVGITIGSSQNLVPEIYIDLVMYAGMEMA